MSNILYIYYHYYPAKIMKLPSASSQSPVLRFAQKTSVYIVREKILFFNPYRRCGM